MRESGPEPTTPTFVDVFAGCGGLSLGLLKAGFKGLFAVEKDRFAFDTLQANLLAPTGRFRFDWPEWLPKKAISINVLLRNHRSQIKALRGSVDVLVGGPPCQGFSSAGRRRRSDPRNKLFSSYLEIVDLVRPKVVLIENVRGFTIDFGAGKRAHNFAADLRQTLANNYTVYEKLLNLSAFGVPQQRTRYFLVAVAPGLSSIDPFELLNKHLPTYLRKLGLQTPVSSSSAISDLEIRWKGRQPSAESKGFEEILYDRPLTAFQKLMAEGVASPPDLRLARHSEEIAKRFAEIIALSHRDGRLNVSISEDVRATYGLKKRALRVLDPDRPSPTVTSMPDDLLHYSEPRTLTVRENARLQAFPDWFGFRGKYTTGGHLRRRQVPRFTQVANAVPPLVAQAFGEILGTVLAHAAYSESDAGAQRGKKSPKLVA